MSSKRFQTLVVGAGPAGMAAAVAACDRGRRVGVLDDNAATGGQIWRRGLSQESDSTSRSQRRLQQQFAHSGATLFAGRRVVSAPEPGTLDTWSDGEETVERFGYETLVLATGARERFLPFPGWTLPGVYGAGGLQALVRGGYDVKGKRVVVAGSGPLLLAVAAHLRQDGAQVIAVCEQAPLRQMLPLVLRLWNRPGKLWQGADLMRQLRGVPYRRGCWPVAAHGGGTGLERVELTDGRRRWTEPCDLLACGFHLVPNTELPALLGCRLQAGCVVVDSQQQTSVRGVFCAGEPTGIAGVDAALMEGRLAGLAAADGLRQDRRLMRRSAAERRFGFALDRAFALRPEVRQLSQPDTILCRCEDVRFADLAAMRWHEETWTDAKLQTRCGMGPCQGRICGPIVETLFGARNESIRPPLFPLPLAALAAELAAESAARRDSSTPHLQETE
jgi:NADPH-dependent 2,4-dienoyl-CoA reductase/sulfur reductase-like enzyme